MTLTDFLLARIAEDEAVVDFDPDAEPWLLYRVGHGERCDYPGDMPGRCTCGAVTRVLADCEAKRRIVGLHDDLLKRELDNRDQSAFGADLMHSDVVRALSAVYADHPDYRDEWRP